MRSALRYLAAVLIAGATVARGQTLPNYDVDALVADCKAQSSKAGEQLAKDLNHPGDSVPPSQYAQTYRLSCDVFVGALERQVREELVKHWDAYDPRKRLWCIAQSSVNSYSTLQNCIEKVIMDRSQP